MKTYFIETFGCQMNVADSQLVESLLLQRGFVKADIPEFADLIIVNTCSVREKAENRALARIEEYSNKKKRQSSIWVMGCMAQRLGNRLKEINPQIDNVIGAIDVEFIAENIDKYLHENHVSEQNLLKNGVSVFLPVMRGCNNFCTYCIVPYVRGREHSIPMNELVETAKKMVDSGAVEITLLGQNVNSYDDNGIKFYKLVEEIHKIEGLKRIRFTTSHPKDLSEELINVIADLPKVCNHIHLPVQAGSDRILKLMNRKYTSADYLRLIDKIRNKIPDVDLTTDVMVGFPSETDKDYKATIELMKKVEFTTAFMFAFSPREGTKAATYDTQVDKKIKSERLAELVNIQTEITKKHFLKMVGKTIEVLFTARQDRKDKMWMGQDYGTKRVLYDSSENLSGKLVKLKVKKSTGMTLVC